LADLNALAMRFVLAEERADAAAADPDRETAVKTGTTQTCHPGANEDATGGDVSITDAATEGTLQNMLADVEAQRTRIEASCCSERILLAIAQAKRRALETRRDQAIKVARALETELAELQEIAREAEDVCRSAEDQATACMEGKTDDTDPSLVALRKRLASAHEVKQGLKARCDVIQAECRHAEAQVLCMKEKIQEAVIVADLDKEAREINERAATMMVEAEGHAAEAERLKQVATATEAASPDAMKHCVEDLESRKAKLTALLQEQGRTNAVLRVTCGVAVCEPMAQPEKQAVETSKSLPTCVVSSPETQLARHAAARLLVSCAELPDICDEYRLLPSAVNGRPVWKASSNLKKVSGNMNNSFLFWMPRDGGCWVLAPALQPVQAPSGEGNAREAELVPWARSLQLAWTTLPEELMPISWVQGGWGEEAKQRITVCMLRV